MGNMKSLFALVLSILILPVLLLVSAIMILSPLRVFNALVPVDARIERVVEGGAYGGDPRQKLDVYRPAGSTRKLPVLVFSYGGAWDSGDRGSYDFIGRAFSKLGYLTVIPDYRLVPQTTFPGFIEDLASAIAWTSSHAAELGGDGSAIFLVGHSAGAYNVALLALDPRYLKAHGLDQSLIAAVATLAGPFDFLPLDDISTIAAFSQWIDLPSTQPVNAVTAKAPPFLLLTGDGDRTVYPRNSKRLAAELQKAAVPHRFIEYPGIGHADIMLALSRPLRWWAPVLEDIRIFFETFQTTAKRS
jgi:acetyl esterase/lipase